LLTTLLRAALFFFLHDIFIERIAALKPCQAHNLRDALLYGRIEVFGKGGLAGLIVSVAFGRLPFLPRARAASGPIRVRS